MSDESGRRNQQSDDAISSPDLPQIPNINRHSVARKNVVRAEWRHRDFKDLNALATKFEGCDFRYSNFERAYFRDAQFNNCKFDGCRFVDCNFKSANFYCCNLKFAHFQRCLLDAREIIASFPPEPNIRREALQNLRANAIETGDQASVPLLVLKEIEAAKLHFRYAMRGYDSYYQAKYPTMALKTKAAVQLWWLHLQGLIWGYGEKPWRLLASCIVILCGLAFINFWNVMPRAGWDGTHGGRNIVTYIVRLFLDMPTNITFRGYAAVDYVVVAMRYIYIGLFISVLYKSISRR